MKEVIAVRTRVVLKPSVSAQIWKDIAKVISRSKTEVASGAPNLVAESRTQEKTTCASTSGSSIDDLSIPAFWFPELGLSHYGKQYLLESYFKWQSSRYPLNFATTYFWIHRELPDYSTSSIRSLSSLPTLFDSGLIQCQQSRGAVTSKYTCLSHEWEAEDDDHQYTIGSGRTERVHRSPCNSVEVFRKKSWALPRTFWTAGLCISQDHMKEMIRQLAVTHWISSDTTRVIFWFKCGVSRQHNAVEPDSMGCSQLACQLAHASLRTPVTVCGDIHSRLYDLLELFRVAGRISNDFPAVDRPLNSDLVKSILPWSNFGTHNVWMRCKEHIKSKFRTSAFSFASMAPNPWSHEDEVIPNFRTPPVNTSRSTALWNFVSGHEDEVIPNFRTPPANISCHTVFWDFVSGYERTVVPTFRSRPLFYGLHNHRLGIG
ncbi:hypothetical protein IG631_00282 [Alternaria alternata]|nr:hypothetical protein IG631_00282 [Alternaria alternata]